MISVRDYLPEHADALFKMAMPVASSPAPPQAGKGEKYMPWYTAAAGGLGGGALAKKVVPKKYRGAAQLAGTLIGTGLGVHGGEAAGKALDKRAEAEEPPPKKKNPTKEIAKTIGAGAAGMAGGTAAGYGAGKLLELAAKKSGRPIKPSSVATYGVPLAGAGLGTAYSLWKAREAQEMRNALEGS